MSVQLPFVVIVVAAGATSALIGVMRPLFARFALAKPNFRSSHRIPTPQGGGIAVIATIISVSLAVHLLGLEFDNDASLIAVFIATSCLALVGAMDDVRPIAALPRLLLQGITILIVVAMLPRELRAVPFLPWWIERSLLFFGLLWFVNVVNFMDGIDWMTVVEIFPVSGALALFGFMGALPVDGTVVALGLCGAIMGFAPYNRPVARLFLGDVGSLPIGLLLGWLLILLAGSGHFASAALLPLYYLADASITLVTRILRREPITQAHRTHFYQIALDRGLNIYRVLGRVFAINIMLVALAIFAFLNTALLSQFVALTAGIILVAALLYSFRPSALTS